MTDYSPCDEPIAQDQRVVVAFDSATDVPATFMGSRKGEPNRHLADVQTHPEYIGFLAWTVDWQFGPVLGPASDSIRVNGSDQFSIATITGGGGNGVYCRRDVVHDNFTYYIDIINALFTGNGMGLVFRANENPASGFPPGGMWQQNGDGFEIFMEVDPSPLLINITMNYRIGGVAVGMYSPFVIDLPNPVGVGLRMGVDVAGDLMDFWTEPIGGGTRVTHLTGVELTDTTGILPGTPGARDSFNDTSHMRFGVRKDSSSGSIFDNITVEQVFGQNGLPTVASVSWQEACGPPLSPFSGFDSGFTAGFGS